ncbi:MAG: SAM-dependent methyltransferase [Pseudomonadota bacterium]
MTAPELGPGFGRCVAQWCAPLLDRLAQPDLVELGAGSGALAAVLLPELDRLGQLPQRYRILEVSGALRARQQAALEQLPARLADRVTWIDAPPAQPWEGLIIGNEVVDALPPIRLCFDGERWRELQVDLKGAELAWVTGPATPAGDALPDTCRITGYVTEVQPMLGPWLAEITRGLTRGGVWLADYGYPASEYFHPQRTSGTAVAHYRHRAHDHLLQWPGLNDLSVSVDFTAVAAAAVAAGLSVAGYTSQAQFLLAFGLTDYAEQHASDGSTAALAALSEIKQLTLPGEMGDRFQVLAASRDLDLPPWPVDQRHRL